MNKFKDFSPRSCPLCGFREGRVYMEVTGRAIFAGNWSYRKQALESHVMLGDQKFPIMCCGNCSFFYAGLLPGPDFLQFIYDCVIDGDAARLNNFSLASLADRMNYVAVLLRLLATRTESVSILDYGCGFGPTLRLLQVIPGVRALGFETSDRRIEEMRSNRLTVTTSVEEVGRNAPFEGIIMDNVLEHLADPGEVVDQIGKWSVHGTVLYVSVPDSNIQYVRRARRIYMKSGALPMDMNPWEHLNYFDLTYLDALMNRHGFVSLKQSDLPAEISVGLRPEKRFPRRVSNSCMSILRCARYAFTGEGVRSVNRRFYRFQGHSSS